MLNKPACLAALIGLLVLPPALASDNPVYGLHQDIISDMDAQEARMAPEMETLWRAMLMRNTTLQLALKKLAEKSGQLKPQDKGLLTHKVLETMIQIGGMGGSILTASPAPLMGSAMVSRLVEPNTAPSQLTEVRGTDLALLTRQIDDAQTELISNYWLFRNSLTDLGKAETNLQKFTTDAGLVVQAHPETAETLESLKRQKQIALDEMRSRAEHYRYQLVMACGEEAVQAVEQKFQVAAEPGTTP